MRFAMESEYAFPSVDGQANCRSHPAEPQSGDKSTTDYLRSRGSGRASCCVLSVQDSQLQLPSRPRLNGCGIDRHRLNHIRRFVGKGPRSGTFRLCFPILFKCKMLRNQRPCAVKTDKRMKKGQVFDVWPLGSQRIRTGS